MTLTGTRITMLDRMHAIDKKIEEKLSL